MILIQSESNDASTIDVMDWLNYLSKGAVPIVRHDDITTIQKLSIKIGDSQECKYDEINESVKKWYRRGSYRLVDLPIIKTNEFNHLFSFRLSHLFHNQNQSLLETLDKKINDINKVADTEYSKVEQLMQARKCDLKIPDTLISNDCKEIENFLEQHSKVITKTFGSNRCSFSYKGHRVVLALDTCLIDKAELLKVKSKSSIPIMLQSYVEKKYELRIFYLKGTFYPMAIFSQENEKTKIDFRNYDEERPNRCVPYKLPVIIEMKLDQFMKNVDMNCGSIDMIYTPQGEYVFLEVNPIGQYQWLERNCNYPISKHIAEELLAEKHV